MGGGSHPSSAAARGGGKHLPGGGVPFSYIPPAAIQNAMMTKDKKPFTYTPGGIDFLAEIRSPRMQRRISKNAADEGVANHLHQTAAPNQAAQQTPSQLSPQALMAMQPQMAVPVFPPTPQQMPVLHSPVSQSTSSAITSPPVAPTHHHHYQHNAEPPPPPPQPLKINLKPAVPQFLQPQSPEQIIQESINSLPGRNVSNPIQSPAAISSPQPTVVSAGQASSVSFPERRNTQLGTIYIPPVTSSGTGSMNANSNGHYVPVSSIPVSPLSTAQLAKAPMPWMNSQNRTPSSPPPPFVHNQQERIIAVEREETKPTSGNVRVIPISVEGGPTPQRNIVKEEAVHPPWHTAQTKVIPIHLESAGNTANTAQKPKDSHPYHQQQHPQQHQQPAQQHQQTPWRTQAAANANQIASMMEE